MNEEAKLKEALKDCLDAMQGFRDGQQTLEVLENFAELDTQYRSLVEAKEIKQ